MSKRAKGGGSPAVGVPTALLSLVGAKSPVARAVAHPWPGSSPALRFMHIAQHSELTPGIATEAERFAQLEMKARVAQDSPLVGAARILQTEVAGRLLGRQKKRVHAAGQAAVGKAERSIVDSLKMQARLARKAMKRAADDAPQPVARFRLSKALKREDGRK